jgi:RND family efflux transporter MFP subunit
MSTLIKTLTSALIISLVAVQLNGCGSPELVEETSSQKTIRPAKIGTVELANGNGMRYFPATVAPSKYAKLAFRINGSVSTVSVVAGQEVEEGQALVKLDDKDLKVQYEQSLAKFNLSKSQLNRAKKLVNDGVVSSAEFDQIQAEFDIAKAQLEIVKNNLEYASITAPFSGVVAALHIEPFEFIQAKQPILELQNREQIDVAIEVPEQLMIRLPKSKKTSQYQPSLVFDVNPEIKYKVKLKEHDISPNPATKSYQVVFTLPTPPGLNVLPGMTGTLEVELNKLLSRDLDKLKVPLASLFIPDGLAATSLESNSSFLYKLTDKLTTELVAVEIVEMHQDGAIIKIKGDGDLRVGNEVIAAGPHLLQQGDKVVRWQQERGL